MTTQEFAATIKNKYPQYRNIGDEELVNRIIQQYPVYKTKIDGLKSTDVAKEQRKQQATDLVKDIQSQKPKSTLEKGADLVDNTLGKASNFLFGNAGKMMGTPIVQAIGGATSIAGKITGNKKLQQTGAKLEATPLPTKTETALGALELYPGGGLVSQGLKKIGGAKLVEATQKVVSYVPEKLKAQAIEQYSKALGATTKELKAKTAKVVPSLLEKRIRILGLKKFENVAQEAKTAAGEAVELAEDQIPETAMTKTKQFINGLKSMKAGYVVDGKVIDEAAVKAIDDTSRIIEQFGDEIPTKSLIKVRRILDKAVSRANKNFTKEEGLTLATEAKEEMVNSIRGVLNAENKMLEKANKEFSLWSNVYKIVKETNLRKSTQSGGLTKTIAPIISGGMGFSQGNDLGDRTTNAIVAFMVGRTMLKAVNNPGWRTVSAVEKNKLANFIASGKINEATLLLTKLVNGLNNLKDGGQK